MVLAELWRNFDRARFLRSLALSPVSSTIVHFETVFELAALPCVDPASVLIGCLFDTFVLGPITLAILLPLNAFVATRCPRATMAAVSAIRISQ